MPKQPAIETWKIADLKPYPKQSEFFGEVRDHEDEELAASIADRGMDHRPEVLSDGTIDKGHRRVRVVRDRLEWTEIEVLVRYDLDGDEIRAEQEFLEDNIHSRKRDKLMIARAYKRLIELAKLRRRDPLDGKPRISLLEQACKRLGCTERNLRRYLRILEAPKEVQEAFTRREVTLVDAAEIAGLPVQEQEEIAEAIRSGEPAKAVAAEYLRGGKTPQEKLTPHFRKFMKNLEVATATLIGQANKITVDPVLTNQHIKVLCRGAALIAELQSRLAAKKRSQKKSRRKVENLINQLHEDDYGLELIGDDEANRDA